MKCLYCHENVPPEGETCPKCGLPLIEDTTLLELSAPEKPSAMDWLNERKAILFAAAGGFAAAVAVGIILIGMSARPEPQVNEAMTPPPPAPVQMASRAPISPVGPSAPTVSDGTTRAASFGVPQPPAPAPVALTPASGSSAMPAAAPVQVSTQSRAGDEDIAVPPPLPENFEYDPQWGFAPPPKPARPRRVVVDEEEEEVTPPSHTLVMDPHRRRGPQFVTIVPNRGTIDGVTSVQAADRLP